jgi:hypothetical protein
MVDPQTTKKNVCMKKKKWMSKRQPNASKKEKNLEMVEP